MQKRSTPLSPIGQLGNLFAGMSRPPQAPSGALPTRPAITVGDLSGGFASEPRQTVAVAPGERHENFTVQTGDVLVSSRSTLLRVALVEPEADGAVLSANLVGVRLNPELLLPEVLLAYLITPEGHAAMESRTSGSTRIRALSVQALAAVEVPVPAAEVQRRVAALVREEFAHYRAAIAAAESRRSAVTHVIARALAQG